MPVSSSRIEIPSGVNVAPERVQDWIVSVINPVLAGLYNERRYLPDGPWWWHHRAKTLERLAPIDGYVAVHFHPNLKDLRRFAPALSVDFDRHDAAVRELGEQVAMVFEKLVTSPAVKLLAKKHLGDPDETDFRFFVSWVAANATRLPNDFEGAAEYNKSKFAERALQAVGVETASDGRREPAKRLSEISVGLTSALDEARTELADRFGVRIVPGDSLSV